MKRFFLSLFHKGCLAILIATVLGVFSAQAATLDAQQAGELARQSFTRLVPGSSPRLLLTHTQSTADGTPAVYVFNNDGGGFILIAADDRPDPVLGYSREGAFTLHPHDLPQRYLLETYALDMTPGHAEKRKLDKRRKAPRRYTDEADSIPSIVDPLLGGIQWDQDYPYFNECPRYNNLPTVTGCVATAVAQIMRYWKHPAQGTGQMSYVTPTLQIPQEVDFSQHTYDWDYMLENYRLGGVMPRHRDAVATLIHDVGVAVQMDYTNGSSAAWSEHIASALTTHFGYDTGVQLLYGKYFSIAEWADILRHELAAGRPLYLAGGPTNGVQHAFVCDGYETEGDFFHINWGWSGTANGLFKLTALAPPEVGIGGEGYDFSANQTAVIGIQPDRGGMPHPVPSLMCYRNSLWLQEVSSTSGKGLILHGSIANYGAEEFHGALGLLATNNDTGNQTTHTVTDNLNMDVEDVIWDYPAYVPDSWLVANTTLQFIYRPLGSDEWQLLRPGQDDLLSVSVRKKDGNILFFEDKPTVNMSITSQRLLTPHPHPGQPALLRFEVQNKAGRYEQPVEGEHKQAFAPPAPFRLSVLKEEGGVLSRVSVQAVSGYVLEEYGKATLDIPLKALPAEPGTYHIALAHSDAGGYYTMIQREGSTRLATIEVTSSPATATEPYLADLVADSTLIEGTPATFIATIGNTGLDGEVSFRLNLSAQDASHLIYEPLTSTINSHPSTLNFQLTSLPAAGAYTATLDYILPNGTWLPLTYSDGTPASLSLSILPAAEPDGIVTPPLGRNEGCTYDLRGRQLSPFEKARLILIRNGKKYLGKP